MGNLTRVNTENGLLATFEYSSIIDTDSYFRLRTFGNKINYYLSMYRIVDSANFFHSADDGMASYHILNYRANDNEYVINEDGYYTKETYSDKSATYTTEFIVE